MPNVMRESVTGGPGRHTPLSPNIYQLADTMRSETRLVVDLIGLLWRQRRAVARDDLYTVEDTAFGIRRVLHTLSEAHRLRDALSRAIGVVEWGAVSGLYAVLKSEEAALLDAERERLLTTTQVLVREAAINRRVLRSTLAEEARLPFVAVS